MKKLIIVTGATKGLGFSISERLLKDGYRVVGISRRKRESFQKLLNRYGEQLFFEPFDFFETEKIHELVKKITKDHGPVYGLVNNAAVGHDGVLATMHESQIRELLKVNVESPILLAKYVSRSMLRQMQGRILNITSIISRTGFNGLSVYGATKAALSGFTKSLAREVGKANITVNAVAPGFMHTDMTSGLNEDKINSITRRSPMKKLVDVSDVASMVLFLMSDEAKHITGTTITVDAGSTA